jgi:hypothetical protein
MRKTETFTVIHAPDKIGLIVALGVVLAIFAAITYEVYVPGQTKEVFGSVVGIEQIANNGQPDIRRYAAVKLENGLTVQA